MLRSRLTVAAMIAAAAAAFSGANAQELRIGFLNTTSGGGALIGKHIENGWKLGLEHEGWTKDGDKLGGTPTRIFYADDQSAKTDVAVREIEKFLKQAKVHIVAGILWSNVMMAVQKPVFEAKVMLLSTNAGPTPLAGELCNPLFVSAAVINDGISEATGEMATKDNIKSVVAIAPNYQAGKDNIAGFQRTYKGGKILDTMFVKINETDFQAEISKLRALRPQALFVFAPGAMGVAFMKQWATSGLVKEIKLYSIYTIDGVTLPAIGDAAIGATEAGHWNPDLDNPKNKRFIREYVAKFGHMPSYFAVNAYDAPGLIAKAMRATGGSTADMTAAARAIRTGTLDSPRGTIKYNVNGMLIQPYWRLNVVKGDADNVVIKGGEQIMLRPDAYWEKCPVNMRT
jgi:branched-chain amino acid transport system substrate-binding protein